jgi:hypothetical protein
MSVTIVSWKAHLCKGGDNGRCGPKGTELWIYLTNNLYLAKTVDGKKIREDRNLFVGTAEMTFVR